MKEGERGKFRERELKIEEDHAEVLRLGIEARYPEAKSKAIEI